MAEEAGAKQQSAPGNNQPTEPAKGKADDAAKPDAPAKPSEAAPAAKVAADAPVESRLDGLRGWLAALDRRVTIRTQVGIVLLALATGFAAAALYVAIDARQNGASEARVESLREALQALNVRTARTAKQVRALNATVESATSQASGETLKSLQAQVTQLQAQVRALQGGPSGTKSGASSTGSGTNGAGSGGTGSASGGTESESPPAATKGTGTK